MYMYNQAGRTGSAGREHTTEGVTHSNTPFVRVNHYLLGPTVGMLRALLFVMAILPQKGPQVYYITTTPTFLLGHIICRAYQIYTFYCSPLCTL